MSNARPRRPNCGGGTLVLQIRFPDCWDGRNLDSADHKSHMAYTVSGICPSNYPVPVPLLEYNVRYKTFGNTGADAWPPARRTRTTPTSSTPGTRRPGQLHQLLPPHRPGVRHSLVAAS